MKHITSLPFSVHQLLNRIHLYEYIYVCVCVAYPKAVAVIAVEMMKKIS